MTKCAKANKIKCGKCKYPIFNNKIIKNEEKDIYIEEKENIAIKYSDNSVIIRCKLCNNLIGIRLRIKQQFMIFKEKICLRYCEKH